MRNIVLSGILVLAPVIGLVADQGTTIKPINDGMEHSFKFGLLHLGYERIKTDCVYTAIETKIASIFNLEDKDKKTLDHYVNGEVRLGYNFGATDYDVITPYGGVGFSVFSVEKTEGKLKNWNYGSLGVKFMHKFGEMFELGLNVKGSMSISQKAYQTFKSKAANTPAKTPKVSGIPTDLKVVAVANEPKVVEKASEAPIIVTETRSDLPPVVTTTFHNDNDNTKNNLTAVKIHDSRFILEIGLPMAWHLGAERKWGIHAEPYYMQIPNKKITHVLGSRLSLEYRY